MRNKIKTALKGLWGKITLKIFQRIVIAFGIFVFFYYLIGMVIVENINDDKDFASDKLQDASTQSNAVSMSIAMIDREVNVHSWISNDPWF